MMKFPIWPLLISAGVAGGTAFGQTCSTTPSLRVAAFDMYGNDTTSSLLPRAMALGGSAGNPGLLGQELAKLDVMCLGNARSPDVRNVVLQNLNTQIWSVYHPPRATQSGCKNACNQDVEYSGYGFTQTLNKWVQYCSLTTIPGTNFSCADLSDDLQFKGCMLEFCPFLVPELISMNNYQCLSCLDNQQSGQTRSQRVMACSTQFVAADAANCKYGQNGEAGGTLISRYPLTQTEYRPLAPALPSESNSGVTYGKIQTPIGPVHLFCSALQLGFSNVPPDSDPFAQTNFAQSQEILDYIRLKSNGEAAVLMGNTGNGPGSATVTPIWETHFSLLQSKLTDALLANLPTPPCTYGCNRFANSPTQQYIDHIMTTGKGTGPGGYQAKLCHQQSGTILDQENIEIGFNLYIPPSDHYGIRTTLSLVAPITVTVSPNLNGPQVTAGGATFTGSRSFTYGRGEPFPITALTPQGFNGGASRWTLLNGTGAFTLPDQNTVTYPVNFKAEHQVSFNTLPPAGGSITPGGTAFYDQGTVLNPLAMANAGSYFAGYTGLLGGAVNPQALTVTGPGVVTANFLSPDSYQVRYMSNLNLGDSVINITNTGARGAGLAAGTTANSTGAICANVYAFSPDEQMISCCSCPVTPNGLVSLSARRDLISNTLTPAVPTSIVVKLLASVPDTGAGCNNSAATVGLANLSPGLLAWGTTLKQGAAGAEQLVETRFSPATLSIGSGAAGNVGELGRLQQLCGFIYANGSGFGTCRSCRLGGLGAGRQ